MCPVPQPIPSVTGRVCRDAASRLATGTDKVLDVALDCGFGDVSNFNRAFRREFGVSPRLFRRASRGVSAEG
jgi:AraC family transcriptional regulator